jgi:hypothetical protein
MDCILVHYGELRPTFGKLPQSTWEDVYAAFRPSFVVRLSHRHDLTLHAKF